MSIDWKALKKACKKDPKCLEAVEKALAKTNPKKRKKSAKKKSKNVKKPKVAQEQNSEDDKEEKKSKAQTAPRQPELDLYAQGYNYVIGVDETGRGSGAGPMYITAAMIPPQVPTVDGVRDSKKFYRPKGKPSAARERMAAELLKQDGAVHFTHVVTVETIDEMGVHKANLLGMEIAVDGAVALAKAKYPVENPRIFVLVDGKHMPYTMEKKYEAKCVEQGDNHHYCIAFASILAKVGQDKYLQELSKKFPMYDWPNNAGHLTPEHIKAIKEYGISIHHRKSFEPMKSMLAAKPPADDERDEWELLQKAAERPEPKVSSAA